MSQPVEEASTCDVIIILEEATAATFGGETEGFHFANQRKSIAGEVRLVEVR